VACVRCGVSWLPGTVENSLAEASSASLIQLIVFVQHCVVNAFAILPPRVCKSYNLCLLYFVPPVFLQNVAGITKMCQFTGTAWFNRYTTANHTTLVRFASSPFIYLCLSRRPQQSIQWRTKKVNVLIIHIATHKR